MITPSKSTPTKHSIIYKMLPILELEFDEMLLIDLYAKLKSRYRSPDEFIYSIDVLYILEKIDFDKNTGMVKRA